MRAPPPPPKPAHAQTPTATPLARVRAPPRAPSTQQPDGGQARSLMSPLRRPHPPGSLAVLPEISSRFKFDWVKVDHRKTEAQEGQVQEGRKIEFFWCEEEKGSDVLN